MLISCVVMFRYRIQVTENYSLIRIDRIKGAVSVTTPRMSEWVEVPRKINNRISPRTKYKSLPPISDLFDEKNAPTAEIPKGVVSGLFDDDKPNRS